MAIVFVSCVLYSCIFCEKMAKTWDLPSLEEDAVQFLKTYEIIPLCKQCIKEYIMSIKTDKQWRCNVKHCKY